MLIAIIMGLGCDPAKDCLGLRPFAEGLADRIAAAGHDIKIIYRSHTDHGIADEILQYVHNHDKNAVVMVGHSLGGGMCVDVAWELIKHGVDVNSMILLDPVPTHGWGFNDKKNHILPDSVHEANCFWRNPVVLPWSLPIRQGCKGAYQNIEMNLSHTQFCSNHVCLETIESRVFHVFSNT